MSARVTAALRRRGAVTLSMQKTHYGWLCQSRNHARLNPRHCLGSYGIPGSSFEAKS